MKKLKEWPELVAHERLEPYIYSREFPPRWFKLENYTGIVNKSISTWHEAISARQFISSAFADDGPDNESWAMYFMSAFWLAQKTLFELHKDDAGNQGKETAMVDMDAFGYAKYLSLYLKLAPDLPLDEILNYENELAMVPPNDAGESLLVQYSLVTDLPVWRIQVDAKEELHLGSLTPVLLDLNAPDELIAESAVEYAKSLRGKLGISNQKQKVSVRDVDKWIDQRLLAYIDLMLWFKAVDERPPLHKIANLIFPERVDIDTSEFIRKTVRKNAHLLMGASVGGALTAQAGLDYLTEKNSWVD